MFATIFNPESPFWRRTGSMADVLGLSALWLILSLPVVTWGAATAALYDAAVRGTQTVTEACLRHGAKLLHVSSTEAVPRGVKLREDLSNYIPDPARVRKGYARAKSAADALVLRAARERGLDASVLLLASVLGPGDTGPGHMSQMMIEFIEGKLPASVRGGYNDFDIRDVADVLPAVVERAQAGESYLFAHKPDSINDVLAVLAEMTGRKAPPALPLWLAYAGAPFLQLAAKLRGERHQRNAECIRLRLLQIAGRICHQFDHNSTSPSRSSCS